MRHREGHNRLRPPDQLHHFTPVHMLGGERNGQQAQRAHRITSAMRESKYLRRCSAVARTRGRNRRRLSSKIPPTSVSTPQAPPAIIKPSSLHVDRQASYIQCGVNTPNRRKYPEIPRGTGLTPGSFLCDPASDWKPPAVCTGRVNVTSYRSEIPIRQCTGRYHQRRTYSGSALVLSSGGEIRLLRPRHRQNDAGERRFPTRHTLIGEEFHLLSSQTASNARGASSRASFAIFSHFVACR